MIDANPYHAPTALIEPNKRRRRRPLGPILAGLAAMILATLLMGVVGLLTSLFAVVSWWAYKFRPTPPAPEVPEARAFLQQLEEVSRGEDPAGESDKSIASQPLDNALRNLQL